MSLNQEKSLSAGLAIVRRRFAATLPQRAIVLARLQRQLDGGVEQINIEESRIVLHQISGTAATLGFADLGDCARDCEESIERYREGQPLQRAALQSGLKSVLEQIDAACLALEDLQNSGLGNGAGVS